MANDSGAPRVRPSTGWASWLMVLLVFGIIGVGLTTALVVMQTYLGPIGQGTPIAEMSMPLDNGAVRSAAPEGFTVDSADSASVPVRAETFEPGMGAVYALVNLPGLVVTLVALVMLYRALSRVWTDHTLFTTETVRALRRCGLVGLVGSAVQLVLTVVGYVIIWRSVVPAGVYLTDSATLSVSLFGLFAGFAALIVSDVVARGTRMRAELEGEGTV